MSSSSPKFSSLVTSSSSREHDHKNMVQQQQLLQQQQQQQQLTTTAGGGKNNNNNGTAKRKRNLPGTPDPDAEVIALSPTTLMATNRFVCEVCNKGFQREQNLQLHRRGHNLPWKLRQRTSKEIKRRVYLCPEPTCVHHDPSRALGDLTGIKKHFCRKHGEKKWKCDKCSKRYAVQSDWKAHSKTCGTREYRCDCGTLFSRRDSFITHRAFCDALAEESARIPGGFTVGGGSHLYGNNVLAGLQAQSIMAAPTSSSSSFRPSGNSLSHGPAAATMNPAIFFSQSSRAMQQGILQEAMSYDSNNISQGMNMYEKPLSGLIAIGSSSSNSASQNMLYPPDLFTSSDLQQSHGVGGAALDFVSNTQTIFTGNNNGSDNNNNSNSTSNDNGGTSSASTIGAHGGISLPNLYSQQHLSQSPSNTTHHAQMSATALLQKAAQMGSTTSNRAFNGNPIPNHTTTSNLSRCFNASSSLENHEGLQDLIMNSLGSTAPTMFGLTNMHQAPTYGGNYNLGDRSMRHGGENERNPQPTFLHGIPQQKMQGANASSTQMRSSPLSSVGNPNNNVRLVGNEDQAAGDRLTRDFLGVGGVSNASFLLRNHRHQDQINGTGGSYDNNNNNQWESLR